MEYALRHSLKSTLILILMKVLILVLMEYALRHNELAQAILENPS